MLSTAGLQRASAPVGRRGRALMQPRRVRAAAASVAPAAASKLHLHVGDTTLTVPFTLEQAQELDAAFGRLMTTFAEKAKETRPKRWELMEVRFRGDPAAGQLELLEFTCNPNGASSAFDARLLVTLRAGGGVAVVTEGRLQAIKADIDSWKQQQPRQ